MAFTNTLEKAEKFQSIFAREADKRRNSVGIKKAASHGNRKDEVSTSGLFRRMTTNISRPGDLVLPRESPRKAYIAPLYPNTFSIEATARESSISDDEELVLLAIKSASLASKAKEHATLRWMHLPHEGIEFEAFLRSALEAYGLDKQAEAIAVSQFLDQIVPCLEKSSFQGKRFWASHTSKWLKLPVPSKETKINLIMMPYFWLGKTPERRNRSHSSKAHWIQPLVQSAYHLDSSISRENQQAIRCLYDHIIDVLHVSQLWILTIGDNFIATCSPTAIYNSRSSSIVTCTAGKHQFPTTIRVTLSSGFVFCLRRDQCEVWSEFQNRVNRVVEASGTSSITLRNWVYKLQKDGSVIEGIRWPSILQSHCSSGPLAILVSFEAARSYQRLPVMIPLEGKYVWNSTTNDHPEYPKASLEILSPQTLDEYKIPYYWDTPKPGEERDIIIAQNLTELDQKILYNHTERLRTMGKINTFIQRPETVEGPYYNPPLYVLEAAKSQAEIEETRLESHAIGQGEAILKASAGVKQPIFKWPIKENIDDELVDSFSHAIRPEVSSEYEPTPKQQMKTLLAHLHYKLIHVPGLFVAQQYNNLPLRTKSDVEREITNLRENHHLNNHIFALLTSFLRRLSHVLGCFIDEDYDCIVKGKVWAATHTVVQTFKSPYKDVLFSFHCSVFAIPLNTITDRIQKLRDGLFGVEQLYIPHSIEKVFLETVLLLVNTSQEASRLMCKIDQEGGDSSSASPSPVHEESPDRQSVSAQSQTETAPFQEWGTQTESPSVSADEEDTQDDSEDDRSTTSTSSTSSLRLRNPEKAFPRVMCLQINMILEYLDYAQDECCAMFSPENEEEKSSYNGIDRGKIIALVLQSVLQGHSTCESIPKLDIEEIYVTYTTHLQLKARSTPSRSLLVDVNLLREELGIIIKNISSQLSVIKGLRKSRYISPKYGGSDTESDSEGDMTIFESLFSATSDGDAVSNVSTRNTLKEIENDLQDRLDVFKELMQRMKDLEKQICQRVEIIQEDHGKAILVFTIVATIFLPLSFVSSYLGMNTADIRDMEPSQALFWEVAAPFTAIVVVAVLTITYNVNFIMGWILRATGAT